jgi:hypothetical protein
MNWTTCGLERPCLSWSTISSYSLAGLSKTIDNVSQVTQPWGWDLDSRSKKQKQTSCAPFDPNVCYYEINILLYEYGPVWCDYVSLEPRSLLPQTADTRCLWVSGSLLSLNSFVGGDLHKTYGLYCLCSGEAVTVYLLSWYLFITSGSWGTR